MALNKPNTQTTAQFETFEDTDMTTQETTTARADVAVEAITTFANEVANAVQVSQPTTSALAVARPKGQLATALTNSNLFENELRGAMAVTWEDFNSINAHSGRFQVKTGAGDPVK